jgi:radical SAM protein with 4Fe4S-binding SPASM domain
MRFRLLSAEKAAGDILPPPGLHSYMRRQGSARTRIHLRLDEQGDGLLLINANRALHLNRTAALMAWLALEEKEEAQAVAALRRRFRIDADTAQRDYAAFKAQLDELARTDGACPIHDLDLEVLPPFSQAPSAPYRMDLALTYRCNNDCAHCYNARPRTFPELPTEQWRIILERLWEEGIPHVCFTGGEPTLRADLAQLIAHAQELGQITGLLTNGRLLHDARFVGDLVEAGLDHVQITLESHEPAIHDRMVQADGAWQQVVHGIRNCLASELYVMTNTTLLEQNWRQFPDTIDFLAEMGVPTVGCNSLIYSGRGEDVGTGLPEGELAGLLEEVRARTTRNGQRLIWYTPTQYCHLDPVQLELGVKACTAAMYNMCIEPDGSVIPCQSFYQSIGNILTIPWDEIWNADLARWLRERRYVPEECKACPVLSECGGGCPLTLAHQQPVAHLNGAV